jgi:hypothetical protein
VPHIYIYIYIYNLCKLWNVWMLKHMVNMFTTCFLGLNMHIKSSSSVGVSSNYLVWSVSLENTSLHTESTRYMSREPWQARISKFPILFLPTPSPPTYKHNGSPPSFPLCFTDGKFYTILYPFLKAESGSVIRNFLCS